MDRRESIKNILLGSIGSSVLLESCVSLDKEVLDKIWEYQTRQNVLQKIL